MKKSFLLFSTSIALAIPLTTIVSCNNDRYSTNDIGGLNDYFNPYPGSKANYELINYVQEIREGNNQAKRDLLDQKTILLTAGGSVNDQSFNQSAWEAISKFSLEIGNNENSYFETKAVSPADAYDSYYYALAKGYKVWILTGFQQGKFLGDWLSTGKNAERFKEANIKVIAVDWFINEGPNDLITKNSNPGQILGLNFKTQQAAFIASYAASELLSRINKEEPEKFSNAYFNNFAGGDFSGATNFNYGFLEGMRQFNQDKLDNLLTDDENPNWFIRSTEPIQLDTTFASTVDSKAKVEKEVNGGNSKVLPQVIFPVAGSLTANAIDFVKAKGKGQWVIGVDSDQSLAFPSDKGLLLTSVEKRISIAIYKALVTLYGLSNYDPNKMESFLGKDYSIDESTGLIQHKVGNEFVKTNFNVDKGYEAGFVSVSKSTLDKNLAFKSGVTYAEAYDILVSRAWDSFFGKDPLKQEGRLQKSISEKGGLKPNDDIINKFNGPTGISYFLINEKPSKEGIQESIKNVGAMKNVFYGYMTAQNKLNYFDPVVQLINSQGKVNKDEQQGVK